MAGPTAGVLTREPVKADDAFLERLVEDITQGAGSALDGFQVTTTRTIGGSYDAEVVDGARPFAIQIAEAQLEADGLAAGFERHFGFRPAAEIVVIAFANRETDHRLLGELTLAIARHYGGIIDFGGALGDGSGAALVPMGGVGLPYVIDSERTATTDMAPPRFLEWWLTQPGFRMVE
jgi:hypothetical protein